MKLNTYRSDSETVVFSVHLPPRLSVSQVTSDIPPNGRTSIEGPPCGKAVDWKNSFNVFRAQRVSVDGHFTLKSLLGLRRECEFCNLYLGMIILCICPKSI